MKVRMKNFMLSTSTNKSDKNDFCIMLFVTSFGKRLMGGCRVCVRRAIERMCVFERLLKCKWAFLDWQFLLVYMQAIKTLITSLLFNILDRLYNCIVRFVFQLDLFI